jgi:hypothetical protein
VPVKSDFGLQSKGHAEQVRNILNKAWFAAYCADKQSEETRMMRSALERVREAALVKFATPNPAHPECATCLEQSVFGGPSHEASPRCRSGRRPHCTCDTCF